LTRELQDIVFDHWSNFALPLSLRASSLIWGEGELAREFQDDQRIPRGKEGEPMRELEDGRDCAPDPHPIYT
jgi:hypothetical protein